MSNCSEACIYSTAFRNERMEETGVYFCSKISKPIFLIHTKDECPDYEIKTCDTCSNYLGGTHCRVNSEYECCEGGGFELWEVKDEAKIIHAGMKATDVQEEK